MVERLLVINGCSHSSGSETEGPGIGDSFLCRDLSFGSLLARYLNRKPIHLALPGGSNDFIARSTACWIGNNIDKIRNKEIDVIFLIHWTSYERWEYRFNSDFDDGLYFFMDYVPDSDYKSFTPGSQDKYTTPFKTKLYKFFQRVFADNIEFWSDNKLKNVVFTQELLKQNDIKYWFGNTVDTFYESDTANSLLRFLDKTYYPYYRTRSKSFYWAGKKAGFDNQSRHIWHLPKEAHIWYTDFLIEEFKKAGLN